MPDAETGIDSLGLFLGAMDDVNGDGRKDLVVGAPHHTTNTSHDGRAYVLSGADGAVLQVIDPISTPNTDNSGQNFGARVESSMPRPRNHLSTRPHRISLLGENRRYLPSSDSATTSRWPDPARRKQAPRGT